LRASGPKSRSRRIGYASIGFKMAISDFEFKNIRTLNGTQDFAFEEFCCQIAQHTAHPPLGSVFTRLRGDGGDGGVECFWTLPSGEVWGWQAKFIFKLDKTQLTR